MNWNKVDPDLKREMDVSPGPFRVIVVFSGVVDRGLFSSLGLDVLNEIRTIKALTTIASFGQVESLSEDGRILRVSLAGSVTRL